MCIRDSPTTMVFSAVRGFVSIITTCYNLNPQIGGGSYLSGRMSSKNFSKTYSFWQTQSPLQIPKEILLLHRRFLGFNILLCRRLVLPNFLRQPAICHPIPVSYTHLDVYKRQLSNFWVCRVCTRRTLLWV